MSAEDLPRVEAVFYTSSDCGKLLTKGIVGNCRL